MQCKSPQVHYPRTSQSAVLAVHSACCCHALRAAMQQHHYVNTHYLTPNNDTCPILPSNNAAVHAACITPRRTCALPVLLPRALLLRVPGSRLAQP
jgi:hypothetical protein